MLCIAIYTRNITQHARISYFYTKKKKQNNYLNMNQSGARARSYNLQRIAYKKLFIYKQAVKYNVLRGSASPIVHRIIQQQAFAL